MYDRALLAGAGDLRERRLEQGAVGRMELASVGSILASAVFMEGARRARSVVFTPVLVVFGFYLVFCNVQVAFENVSHRSDDRSDHRRTAMVAAKNGSSQRSQWSQGRSEAATARDLNIGTLSSRLRT